jgi:hypothetical protein
MRKCPQCGEESEDQFDSCWHCQCRFDGDTASPEKPDSLSATPNDVTVGTGGYYWLASILVPLSVLAGGFAIMWTLPANQDDWVGARFILVWLASCVLASILAIAFAVASVRRPEKWCGISILAGLAGLGFLIYVGIALLRHFAAIE